MASISVELDIEDYLDEISDEALIRELRSRKSSTGHAERLISNIDADSLESAHWHLRNGRHHDACHYLEVALGRDWFGAIARLENA